MQRDFITLVWLAIEDQFRCTARLGKLKDPFGQVWFILSRVRL